MGVKQDWKKLKGHSIPSVPHTLWTGAMHSDSKWKQQALALSTMAQPRQLDFIPGAPNAAF